MKLGQAFVVTDIPEYSAVALACLGPKEPGYDDLEALDVTKVTDHLLPSRASNVDRIASTLSKAYR